MTPAYRLKGLGWLGGITIVALGLYLLSLQAAAERKRLDQVNAKIVSAERDIRALETEFDVRANLAQLERWNGDTLSLVAPVAGQFVENGAALAQVNVDGPAPGGDTSGVQMASLVVPSLPTTTAPPPPRVIDEAPKAAAVQVAAVVRAAPKAAAPEKAGVMKIAAVKTVATARPADVQKAKAVAMLDKTLLSDSTLGDLLSGARRETRLR